jgi:hypothetical protein
LCETLTNHFYISTHLLARSSNHTTRLTRCHTLDSLLLDHWGWTLYSRLYSQLLLFLLFNHLAQLCLLILHELLLLSSHSFLILLHFILHSLDICSSLGLCG